MLLFDNAWPSNYEEIKTWYPVWYRDILEMDALWRAWGNLSDDIQNGIMQAVDNNFIDYANAQAISRMEVWLGITHDPPKPLAERREYLKQKIKGFGRFGQEQIKQLAVEFLGFTVDVTFENGEVSIDFSHETGGLNGLLQFINAVERRIPAHLGLGANNNVPPLNITNDFQFLLADLAMQFSLKNITAPHPVFNGEIFFDGTRNFTVQVHGIHFADLEIGVSIQNLRRFEHGLILDSDEPLDGAYLLDGNRFNMQNVSLNSVEMNGQGINNAATMGISGKVQKPSVFVFDGTQTFDGTITFGIIEEEF